MKFMTHGGDMYEIWIKAKGFDNDILLDHRCRNSIA